MMNRKQRHGYLDRMRKNQEASMCPGCGRKARHFTVPSPNGADGVCDIVCEWCNKTIKTGVTGVKPYQSYRLYRNI